MLLFWTIFKWVRRVLYLVVLAVVIYLLITSVQVITAARVPRTPGAVSKAAAIVVIGAPSTGSELTPDGLARCAQAASLYDDHRAPLVYAAGGRASRSDPNERSLLATCMEHRGVPRRAVRVVLGTTVPGALSEVAHHLLHTPLAGSPPRAILVADPLETKWLRGVAGNAGLQAQVSPAPAPKVHFWSTIGQVWNQTLAVAYGQIFGFGGTTWMNG